ncbi:MAG: hypothetical protein K5799_14690 [Erythrobacter sp.]|nr:hypothetical protein [Erythrobacter sp.]
MYIRRRLTADFVLRYTWTSLLWTAIYSTTVVTLFFWYNVKWIDVPFELVSTVGIAVSFFIGFKNNQAYDRYWEGRKIWGQIVNYSRTWGMQIVSLVGHDGELRDDKKVLIHRHIAWLYALRTQLRRPNGAGIVENPLIERLISRHRETGEIPEVIGPFVSDDEGRDFSSRANSATRLIHNQAKHLQSLGGENGHIDGFDRILLMETLEKFYDLQGMCERIKNTPFPRQFAFFSQFFTVVFCLILPLGLLEVYEQELLAGVEFARTFGNDYRPTTLALFAIIPLSVLVSWIFLTWEKIGDSSEDPFEGRPFDVSMTALCRTIEIDLRDMLDEPELPQKTPPRDNILY